MSDFRFIRAGALAGILALAAAAPASAAALMLGSLEISGLWTQAVPPGAPTAVAYMTIQNHGSVPDRLTAAASTGADHGELHQMSLEGGIMQMRPLPGPLDIPAGGKVVLDPRGSHVMLVGLKQRPQVGSTFPLTLTFEKGGTIDVQLTVLPIGAKGPPADGQATPPGSMGEGK